MRRNRWSAGAGGVLLVACLIAGVVSSVAASRPIVPSPARWCCGHNLAAGAPTPINALVVDPHDTRVVYAGAETFARSRVGNGLFKSKNRGATWKAAGLRDESVQALALDPLSAKRMYAGTIDGVFRTTDGGRSWRNVHLIANKNHAQRSDAIAINPRNPKIVYAATTAGVFKTGNGGKTWRNVLAEGKGYAFALAIDPQSTQIVYAGAYAFGVFKTTDSGAEWRHIDVGDEHAVLSLAVDPKNPQIVYAGAGYDEDDVDALGGVFESTDRGESWRHVGLTGLEVDELAIDPETPSIVYAGTSSGVHKSTDGGATWTLTGFEGQSINALTIDPRQPQTVYVGTETAVFKSADGGSTWSRSSRGIKNP